MKSTFLLPLLVLVSAAPARPAAPSADRLLVQMRHVEYTPKPEEPEVDSLRAKMEIPLDAKDLISLQVLAEPGAPFETVAVVNGVRYSLAGKLTKPGKASDGKDYVRVEFGFRDEQDGIMQVKSNVMVEVDQEIRMGGMMRGPKARGLILSLKRPDVAPVR
jgi:hypothetical protein